MMESFPPPTERTDGATTARRASGAERDHRVPTRASAADLGQATASASGLGRSLHEPSAEASGGHRWRADSRGRPQRDARESGRVDARSRAHGGRDPRRPVRDKRGTLSTRRSMPLRSRRSPGASRATHPARRPHTRSRFGPEPSAASAWEALDLAAFLREPPPEPDWLLEGFVEHGELVWLAGPGKVGKSMVVLFLACAALAGDLAFLGANLARLDWVVYVDGENSATSVRRRIHLAGVPIEVAGQIDYQSVRGVDLGATEHREVLAALATRPGRGLVILDSLIALHRADEDKASEVRAFVTGLRAIAEAAGVTMIGLAHENRGGNLRGSLDWRNAADTVLEVRKDDAGWRTLKIGDRRNGAEDVSRVFRFAERGERLVIESTGSALGNPGGRPATRREILADQIADIRRAEPGVTRAETARRLGTTSDHGTFRKAWNEAGSRIGAVTAGAPSQEVPGRQGTPLTGVPVPAPLPLPDAHPTDGSSTTPTTPGMASRARGSDR